MYQSHISPVFRQVSCQDFQTHIQSLVNRDTRYRDNLSVQDCYDRFDCYMSCEKNAGFALSHEKDVLYGQELVNVFSTVSGTGVFAVKKALELQPRLWLTCYSGLETFYDQFGFKVVDVMDNWCYGGPDVLKMTINGTGRR